MYLVNEFEHMDDKFNGFMLLLHAREHLRQAFDIIDLSSTGWSFLVDPLYIVCVLLFEAQAIRRLYTESRRALRHSRWMLGRALETVNSMQHDPQAMLVLPDVLEETMLQREWARFLGPSVDLSNTQFVYQVSRSALRVETSSEPDLGIATGRTRRGRSASLYHP